MAFEPHGDDFDRIAWVGVGETLQMQVVKGLGYQCQRVRIHAFARPRDVQFEGLAFVAQIGGEDERALRIGDAIVRQPGSCLFAHDRHHLGNRRNRLAVEWQYARAREIVADIRMQNAPGREGAGIGREDDAGDVEFVGDRAGMDRTGAAEGQQREIARVEALFEQAEADCGGEAGIGDGDDAAGRALEIEAERACDLVDDRGAGGRKIERHDAAEEIIGVEPAEHQVRVGHGRLGAATP